MRLRSNGYLRKWQSRVRAAIGRTQPQMTVEFGRVKRRHESAQPIPALTKLWLLVIILLTVLALLIGGWVGLTTHDQRWLEDVSNSHTPSAATLVS